MIFRVCDPRNTVLGSCQNSSFFIFLAFLRSIIHCFGVRKRFPGLVTLVIGFHKDRQNSSFSCILAGCGLQYTVLWFGDDFKGLWPAIYGSRGVVKNCLFCGFFWLFHCLQHTVLGPGKYSQGPWTRLQDFTSIVKTRHFLALYFVYRTLFCDLGTIFRVCYPQNTVRGSCQN